MKHAHTHFKTDDEIASDIADTIDLFDAVFFDYKKPSSTWYEYEICFGKVRDLLRGRDDLQDVMSEEVERLVVWELVERLNGWKYARGLKG